MAQRPHDPYSAHDAETTAPPATPAAAKRAAPRKQAAKKAAVKVAKTRKQTGRVKPTTIDPPTTTTGD